MDNGRLRCDLCPRHCHLSEGQRGFCFVRQNIDGVMNLTTYGRSSGFCLDPIEKKPLNHFLPGTSILSFGTAGCNLGCKFCQNWSISKSREFDRLQEKASPKRIAQAAQELGAKSVAFTYNDPVIFAEYAIDCADACRAAGIYSVAKTAGYITEKARPEFFSHMDAANVDLKAFSDRFYRNLTLAELKPVLDTLIYIKSHTSMWLEITTLLIPDENDSPKEVEAMARWIKGNLGPDVPLHFTAFHPDYRLMNKSPTSLAILARSRGIALAEGLKYVYTGNVHDPLGASTYCYSCQLLLIERDWYELGEYHLVERNHCQYCDAILPGVFDLTPGNWGRRRVPVSL